MNIQNFLPTAKNNNWLCTIVTLLMKRNEITCSLKRVAIVPCLFTITLRTECASHKLVTLHWGLTRGIYQNSFEPLIIYDL